MLSTDSVWNRRVADAAGEQISHGMFNLVIGLCLVWGFGLNYVMVQVLDAEVLLSIHWLAFLIGFIGCSVVGTAIYAKSDVPAISFAGYTLVVLPLGLLMVRVLHFYDADVIAQAFLTTGLATCGITVAAMSFPSFFLSLGRGLFIAFIVAFVAEIAMYFITGSVPPIFDWIFVVIFSGYIGYDWVRAQMVPKTVDNAIDCAAALYVDIAILFLRLVRIFGRR
jgi:FtsH-binding integral membrane protein